MGKQDERKTLEARETVETVEQKFCSRLSLRHAPGYAGHVKNAKVLIFMSLVCVIRNVMGLIKDVTSLRHEHPGKSSKNIGLMDVAKRMMFFKVCVSKQNLTLYTY